MEASQDLFILPPYDFQIPTPLILDLNQHFPQCIPCNTRPKRCSVKKQFHDQLRIGNIVHTFSSWESTMYISKSVVITSRGAEENCLAPNILILYNRTLIFYCITSYKK